MAAFIRTWILNIATVIIFISFIEILLPNSSMKKYIKMIVGLLVMLVVLNPVIELMNGKIDIENEIMRTSLLIDETSLTIAKDNLGGLQEKQMLQYYKAKVEGHIKDKMYRDFDMAVEKVTVVIDENSKSDKFGQIQGIEISIASMEKDHSIEKDIQPVTGIHIIIGKDNIANEEDENFEEDNKKIQEIKNSISSFYDVNDRNIHINVRETSH